MASPTRTARLQAEDHRYLWHPFTQQREWEQEPPLIIERGRGVYLEDTDGHRYLDGVSSLWVNLHGHRKRELDRALVAQLKKIAHSTLLGLANVPSIELARRLLALAPRGLTRVFYSDDGFDGRADAVGGLGHGHDAAGLPEEAAPPVHSLPGAADRRRGGHRLWAHGPDVCLRARGCEAGPHGGQQGADRRLSAAGRHVDDRAHLPGVPRSLRGVQDLFPRTQLYGQPAGLRRGAREPGHLCAGAHVATTPAEDHGAASPAAPARRTSASWRHPPIRLSRRDRAGAGPGDEAALPAYRTDRHGRSGGGQAAWPDHSSAWERDRPDAAAEHDDEGVAPDGGHYHERHSGGDGERCHCERSEAISWSWCELGIDCFVGSLLAM